uniref:Uncharacterized protein n=1 Tax=Arundo donax TaxID=35708 RepID=A0A0A9BI74_ARUDO
MGHGGGSCGGRQSGCGGQRRCRGDREELELRRRRWLRHRPHRRWTPRDGGTDGRKRRRHCRHHLAAHPDGVARVLVLDEALHP